MGDQSSLDLTFNEPVVIIDVIDCLLSSGWTYNDHGNIVVLPLGDNDMFDWKIFSLDQWGVVYELIKIKMANSELIGLALTWEGSMIGGEFLFHPDLTHLSVCISINRKMVESSKDTDFSWYISHVVDVLKEKGFGLEKYETVVS